jgi:hypothetical protein
MAKSKRKEGQTKQSSKDTHKTKDQVMLVELRNQDIVYI